MQRTSDYVQKYLLRGSFLFTVGIAFLGAGTVRARQSKPKAKKYRLSYKKRYHKSRKLFRKAEKARSKFLTLRLLSEGRGRTYSQRRVFKDGRSLYRLYNKVVNLNVSRWLIASRYRQCELNEIFARKMLNAPVPKRLSKKHIKEYKGIISSRAFGFLEKAASCYAKVYKRAKKLKLRSQWRYRAKKKKLALAKELGVKF